MREDYFDESRFSSQRLAKLFSGMRPSRGVVGISEYPSFCGQMEFTVYERAIRRLGLVMTLSLLLGMFAAFGITYRLLPHGGTSTKMPVEFYILIFTVGIILPVFAIAEITTGVTIRIERATGEIFRMYTLLGREVRRERFNLSDFDRVSLSRGFRTGYRVSLLGRERDLLVCYTTNLGAARDRADKVAAAWWVQGQRPPIGLARFEARSRAHGRSALQPQRRGAVNSFGVVFVVRVARRMRLSEKAEGGF